MSTEEARPTSAPADVAGLVEELSKCGITRDCRNSDLDRREVPLDLFERVLEALSQREPSEAADCARRDEIALGKSIAFEEAARLIEKRNPNEGGRLDAAAIRNLKKDESDDQS